MKPRSMSVTEEKHEYEAIESWLREQPQDAQKAIMRQVEYMCGYKVGWKDGRFVVKDMGMKVTEPDMKGCAIKRMGLRTALVTVYWIGCNMQEEGYA